MTTQTTPTIVVDPQFDLAAGGRRNTDAAQASFASAYRRAAARLGFVAVVSTYSSAAAAEAEDHAGYSDETIRGLWQAAHDALRESRPGRWVIRARAADLRARGRRLLAVEAE